LRQEEEEEKEAVEVATDEEAISPSR